MIGVMAFNITTSCKILSCFGLRPIDGNMKGNTYRIDAFIL